MIPRILRSETLYRGKVFDLIVDRVEYPSGVEGVREIARHPGGSVVVPLFDDGQIMLVRQFRHPLQAEILELPAGKLAPGEDPGEAARRELEEETGWTANRLERLTSIYTTPGFCDEILHIFKGTDLRPAPGGHRREEGERSMTIHIMPMEEIVRRIEHGDIRDAKTVVGVLLAARRALR